MTEINYFGVWKSSKAVLILLGAFNVGKYTTHRCAATKSNFPQFICGVDKLSPCPLLTVEKNKVEFKVIFSVINDVYMDDAEMHKQQISIKLMWNKFILCSVNPEDKMLILHDTCAKIERKIALLISKGGKKCFFLCRLAWKAQQLIWLKWNETKFSVAVAHNNSNVNIRLSEQMQCENGEKCVHKRQVYAETHYISCI